jgi:hypothetical protein
MMGATKENLVVVSSSTIDMKKGTARERGTLSAFKHQIKPMKPPKKVPRQLINSFKPP